MQRVCASDRARKEMKKPENMEGLETGFGFIEQKSKERVIKRWSCRGIWCRKLYIREEGAVVHFTDCIAMLQVK